MNDHISKPIDVEAVFETLAKWIKSPVSNGPSKNQISEPSIEIDFSTLENVNIKEGLARCQGNQHLYWNLLNDFAKSQASFIKRFNDATEQGAPEKLSHLAHELKGVSANIGATMISELANSLEKAVKADKTEISTILERLELYLEKAVTQINATTPTENTEATHTSSTSDSETVPSARTTLMHLEKLLIESDIEAQDVILQLVNDPNLQDYNLELTTLEGYIYDFDFKEALDYFKELKGLMVI
ncbi:sensory box histidine kinase [Vibrio ishigakensis]|uniref:Sensory box histidine kinase n=1 Tax=Vibrio ishigakensis TaxID=1481914 RepID=A0A0B8QFE7_9VIBR|nr:sensory box histidine kinase [Vibrio ishigakensis]